LESGDLDQWWAYVIALKNGIREEIGNFLRNRVAIFEERLCITD
jgi:hypothetical protein